MGNGLLLFLLLDSSYKDSDGAHVRGRHHILGRSWTMSLPTVGSTQEEIENANLTGETARGLANRKDNMCQEEEPQLLRLRERRAAFVDTKTEIGETEDSETRSSNNLLADKRPEEPMSEISGGEKNSKHTLRNQQSADELRLPASSPIREIWKSTNQAFLKLVERKSKARESSSATLSALNKLKPSVFHDKYLAKYANSQLSPLALAQRQRPAATPLEQKRLEAVWELFLTEVTFLSEHIMVLKHCFSEPLKSVQVEGYLMHIEPSELFGNLDELCYVSYVFCRDLLKVLVEEGKEGANEKPSALIQPLLKWSAEAKDGEIFHDYCLNYDSALSALDRLRKDEQFQEFERWCTNDPRCRRLKLTDLLIAPLQHYAKIPILLGNIQRYTEDEQEGRELTQALGKVESSLRQLEEKMSWLQNLERLQALQKQLIWPSVLEADPRIFVPEFLRKMLSRQPCESILANPKRKLVYEGFLNVNDAGKFQEMYAFLFDDFLLLTRVKKAPKTKPPVMHTLIAHSPTEGGLYAVHKQPIALDRCTIHNVGATEAAVNGLKHAFVLITITRFQQITDVYTIQASSEVIKNTWLEQLSNAQVNYQVKLKEKLEEIRGGGLCTNKHSKFIYTTPTHQTTVRCHLTLPDFETPKPRSMITASTSSSPGGRKFYTPDIPSSSTHSDSPSQAEGVGQTFLRVNQRQEKSLVFASSAETSGSRKQPLDEGLQVPAQDPSLPWPRSATYYRTLSRNSLSTYSFRSLSKKKPSILDKTISKSNSDEFSYNINEQLPFSPPLSPVLHTPTLPMDDVF